MTRWYLMILISLGTAITDPSYTQISPDFVPCPHSPWSTFAASPSDDSKGGFDTGLTSSLRCLFDIFSIADPQTCLQQRLERWPWSGLTLLPAPLPCTKIR